MKNYQMKFRSNSIKNKNISSYLYNFLTKNNFNSQYLNVRINALVDNDSTPLLSNIVIDVTDIKEIRALAKKLNESIIINQIQFKKHDSINIFYIETYQSLFWRYWYYSKFF